ncbi:MAG: prolyl oligopeptidase family protein [Phycisphaerales bacterium]
MPTHYPQTRTDGTVDEHFGTKVPDPYRWLEDDNSAETAAWVKAQNEVTEAYLANVPQRPAIKARLTRLWDYEKFGLPIKEGGRYFYSRNDGLQPQNVLYVCDSLDGPARVLLDPNTYRADGTAALTSIAITDDGKHMAYGMAEAGSDWESFRVRTVADGKDTADEVNWVKFSEASWTKDGAGFFYSRFDAPKEGDALSGVNRFQKVYYHRLGTPQAEDVLVYERPDQPEWGFAAGVSEDGAYLVLAVWQGTDKRNRVFYRELPGGRADSIKAAPAGATFDFATSGVVELLPDLEAQYTPIGNVGRTMYFVSDLEAPRGRVIAIDLDHPEKSAWKTIVPQGESTLVSASLVGGRLICQYLKDAASLVKVFETDGTFVRNVDLPGLGTASGFSGKQGDTETFYAFLSYTVAPTIYRYDVRSGVSTVFKQARVDFDASKFETKQVFYTSKDGTKVPMFITARKGVTLDGSNPTLLYGYGGFNIPLTPSFSPAVAVWLEMGGVYAVANLRGGGEYGEQWHKGGMKTSKQNVFDDFIAAGEHLIASGYTRRDRLAIQGGSNGGLLVGACMTQRPELFGAALPIVGVMDMLRYQKFTIGWAWASDFGAAEDSPEMFEYLLGYSPYHRLLRDRAEGKGPRAYPPTMVITADHDDRVVPAHSFKFAAALQAAGSRDWAFDPSRPLLIRIETRAGHGAGKPTAKKIEEAADQWAFLCRALGFDPALK